MANTIIGEVGGDPQRTAVVENKHFSGFVIGDRRYDAQNVTGERLGFKVGLDLYVIFEEVEPGKVLVSIGTSTQRRPLFKIHPTGYIDYTGDATVDEQGIQYDQTVDWFGGIHLIVQDLFMDDEGRINGRIELMPTHFPHWRGNLRVVARGWVAPEELTPWPEGAQN